MNREIGSENNHDQFSFEEPRQEQPGNTPHTERKACEENDEVQ